MADTEAELCSRFRAWVEARGWTVHSEVSNWDQVLVPSKENWEGLGAATWPEWKPGDAVGVHAKLRASVEVLWQCVSDSSVPWRFVLVPRPGEAFRGLASRLGIGVIASEVYRGSFWGRPGQWHVAPLGFAIHAAGQTRQKVVGAITLPEVVTDLPAGVPSPKQLTRWRAQALRLCHILRTRGWVTSKDFKELSISPERWKDCGWLKVDGKVEIRGRQVQRLIAGGVPLPDVGWEEIKAQLVNLDSQKNQEKPVASQAPLFQDQGTVTNTSKE